MFRLIVQRPDLHWSPSNLKIIADGYEAASATEPSDIVFSKYDAELNDPVLTDPKAL